MSDTKVISQKQYYGGLDVVRTIAAAGIVLMHVCINAQYELSEPVYNLIRTLSSFVELFMILSGFSICCGYYEKIKNNQISLNTFYLKRYKRVWPFFALIVLLDGVFSWRYPNTLYEVFADLTLLYGFLPGNGLEVVGVGWTLGVTFAFYIIFPFFVFMIWNKRRAWVALAVSYLWHYCCEHYFFGGKTIMNNLLQWLYLFLLGGLIYLYKDELVKYTQSRLTRILAAIILFAVTGIYIWKRMTLQDANTVILHVVWVIAGIILLNNSQNRMGKFFSSVSFEIYLSHMMIYTIIKKLGWLYPFGKGALSLVVTSILVFVGATIFSHVAKHSINRLQCILTRYAKYLKSFEDRIKKNSSAP